jgi:reactive chlorine resistance protein C
MQDQLISIARRISGPFLRISLAVILGWIGLLKFVDPSPVLGLLQASMPLLAVNAFVYLLGTVEIIVALMLLGGIMLPYAGLIVVALFAATLTILLSTPSATNIPTSSLVGQFLLKDLGRMAAAVQIIAAAPIRESRRMAAQAVAA